MPLPVIAGVDRIALTWSDSSTGLQAMNVMHVHETAPTASNVVAGDFLTACDNLMWIWMANTSRITQIDVTPLDGVSATYSASVAATADTTGGSGLANPLPAVAGLIKLTTANRGGSYRGRVYIPNVAEGEVGGRTLIDVATCQTAWDTFRTDLIAAGIPLQVASYTLGAATEVTSCLAEDIVATQRRRVRR